MLGIAATVSAGILSGGAFASSASACGLNQCAWANANYGGGFLGSNGYGVAYPNYTEVGGPYEGCTHVSFNDCASSIQNAGPYNVYYYENAGYGGNRYTNNAKTEASFLGSFWNDRFSSDIIG
ncbi:MAG: peptidase inhibitor family I36 protein [Solirubrobacteraceae bacterium]